MNRIELDNFILTGLRLTEADYPIEDERLGSTEPDDTDDEYDPWYEGNSFEVDWSYAHGQY